MKVTFDLDGVVIEHLEYTLKQMGISINKINVYSINKVANLTDYQKKTILKSFSDIETFRNAYKHSDVLNRLASKYEIIINSFSCSPDIANYKIDWINSELRNIKENNIKLNVLSADRCGTGEKLIEPTDVYVEDCLENLLNNIGNFNVGVLIDKPYNRIDVELDEDTQIIRVKDIFEAEKLINTIALR